jgi:hypothetical protein
MTTLCHLAENIKVPLMQDGLLSLSIIELTTIPSPLKEDGEITVVMHSQSTDTSSNSDKINLEMSTNSGIFQASTRRTIPRQVFRYTVNISTLGKLQDKILHSA